MSYFKATLLGVIIGGICFYLVTPNLPNKYTASGIFVISRKVDQTSGFFTYEGYYADQTAGSYVTSFLAILQSEEVKKAALEETKGLASNEELRKLRRLVRAKKEGSRVVNLRVRASTESEAKNTWNAIAQSAMTFSSTVVKDTDPALRVEKSVEAPIVSFSELNRYVMTGFGAGAGGIFGFFCYLVVKYLKESRS